MTTHIFVTSTDAYQTALEILGMAPDHLPPAFMMRSIAGRQRGKVISQARQSEGGQYASSGSSAHERQIQANEAYQVVTNADNMRHYRRYLAKQAATKRAARNSERNAQKIATERARGPLLDYYNLASMVSLRERARKIKEHIPELRTNIRFGHYAHPHYLQMLQNNERKAAGFAFYFGQPELADFQDMAHTQVGAGRRLSLTDLQTICPLFLNLPTQISASNYSEWAFRQWLPCPSPSDFAGPVHAVTSMLPPFFATLLYAAERGRRVTVTCYGVSDGQLLRQQTYVTPLWKQQDMPWLFLADSKVLHEWNQLSGAVTKVTATLALPSQRQHKPPHPVMRNIKSPNEK